MGLQHHFRPSDDRPSCLSDRIRTNSIRIVFEAKDRDARTGEEGNILDSINSPREWLAATHKLFDVVDLQRKSVFVRIWQSKKCPTKKERVSSFHEEQRNEIHLLLSFFSYIFAIHFFIF